MTDELELQLTFAKNMAAFIGWIFQQPGYGVTFGEAWRTPEQAALDADKGIGIKNSLHTQRLAVDLNLFIDGELQTTTSAYEDLGIKWESMGGCWGGRFAKPDGNHFSMEFQGVK